MFRLSIISYFTTLVFFIFLFLIYPKLDLSISRLFFSYEQHGFSLVDNDFLYYINRSVYWSVYLLIMIAILIVVLGIFFRDVFLAKKSLYLLLVLLVGPGLIVNLVLKDNFGRARPRNIKEFNGDKKFSSAFYISNQCKQNCSFTSGDVSVGFVYYSLCYI